MTDEELLQASTDLRVALGRLVRRLRQGYVVGELTLPERSVLSRLDREGPATPGCLADLERVKPQAMGVTLAGLVERGLVERRKDDSDGRKVLMSVTDAGVRLLTDRRSVTTERMATALAERFTAAEQRKLIAAIPLVERLADAL
ncbi:MULTISPECIES: MarR family winged helix-turn-helix transcriptional regulator [unclassified Amycolatopsis]|uniref:MarR family winged helix-turn-helix transcriptional regulator n=1 Tax=unclassified Amycolatopsis TaxID=2618356 RepID=UPI002E12E40D|nr:MULTISPECIES: MarR family transcriptional regulator [unclassified Amycolatopsis]WSJ80065.1 MarR family transcriptional regulator [Amycolatopsis sp. NBC_01307]WSK76443.1 MarR family transcriptional regulator [Amycolatopsis sp. NBC_01286]